MTFSPIHAKIFPVHVPYTGFRPQYIKEEKIMNPKNNRSSFSGKIGFVLSAAGASVGLGNIWRFPYLAAKYGGGIFLLIYIVLALTFGYTMIVAESALGRMTRKSPVGAFQSFGKKKWMSFGGWINAVIPILIVPYYSVIGGWVIKYLLEYIRGDGAKLAEDGYFSAFISDGASTELCFVLFCMFTLVIIFAGVRNGVERVSKLMMPVLVVLSVIIAVYSVTRPGALAGVKYFLVPNPANFSWMTVVAAMGQMFYSLSIAMGILITFGSYMKKDTAIEDATRNVEVFDTAIAIMAGLMIIPAVYTFMGTEGMSAGPGLMFVSLPKVFKAMGAAGVLVGIVFFLMVSFAAVTSSVSVMEAIVSSMMDKFHVSRKKGTILTTLYGMIVGVIVCLGYNKLYFELKLPNGTVAQILDVMDYISNNCLMPMVALLTCILIGWVVKPKVIIDEVTLGGYRFGREKLYVAMIKVIAPLMLLILLVQSVGL